MGSAPQQLSQLADGRSLPLCMICLSSMYRRILGFSYPILYMCFAQAILQASLLAHLCVFSYSPVGLVPFLMPKELVSVNIFYYFLGDSGTRFCFLEVWWLVACDALTLWCQIGEPQAQLSQ
jgi:hypothetical protein